MGINTSKFLRSPIERYFGMQALWLLIHHCFRTLV